MVIIALLLVFTLGYYEGIFVPGCFVSMVIFALLLVFTLGNVEIAFVGTIILVSVWLFFVNRDVASMDRKTLERDGSLSEVIYGCIILTGLPLLFLCVCVLLLFFRDSYYAWMDSFMERTLGTTQGIKGVIILAALVFVGTSVIPRFLAVKKSPSQSDDEDDET